jgi:hypothetical protein
MEKIIDRTLFIREDTPYCHDIRVLDLGRGQLEATILPRFAWRESDVSVSAEDQLNYEAVRRGMVYRHGGWVDSPPSAEELLDRAAANRLRSTRRARTKVRRLAKFKGLTTLLTLTYRENMQDRGKMQRDLDVFVKRVRRVCTGFQYICVFERQKRGAWHAHLAVQKILATYVQRGALVRSYDMLRSMWRGVVGIDNGNVDVSRNRRLSRSPAKLASYLSKYIGKTFGDAEKYANSYQCSGRTLPDAVLERYADADLAGAIGALFDLVAVDVAKCELHHALLDGGGYFLSLSPHPS